MDTSKVTTQERSCNTCIHHVQATSLDNAPTQCWDCVGSKSLIHWEGEPATKLQDIPGESIRSKLIRTARHFGMSEETIEKIILKPVVATDDVDEAPKTALNSQVAGDHYKKLKIQPMEYSMANKLDACQHTVIKYVTRFRDKGGKQDLDKAIHAIELLKEIEYGQS